MAKKNMDMMESGAKVKLGVSDVIIRGLGMYSSRSMQSAASCRLSSLSARHLRISL